MAQNSGYIRYLVPALAEVIFTVEGERKVVLEVSKNCATVTDENGDFSKSLAVKSEDSMDWVPKEMSFHVYSDEPCIFKVEGNPRIQKITVRNNMKQVLNPFKGSLSKDGMSLDFDLIEGAQLRIFPSVLGEKVKFANTNGEAEVFGATLDLCKSYNLFPGSPPVFVNPRPDRQCRVNVEKKYQRIDVIVSKEKYWQDLETASETFNTEFEFAISSRKMGPKVLVTGERHIGKTACCYFLLNKAIEHQCSPIYVDLDVCGTFNNISGMISITEITKYTLINKGFYGQMIIFYFGSSSLLNNLDLYYLLIKEVGRVLNNYLTSAQPQFKRSSGVVIDMCGIRSQDFRLIEHIIKSIKISHAFTVADLDFCKNLDGLVKRISISSGLDCCTRLIEKPIYIEKKDDIKEKMNPINTIKRYFGIIPMYTLKVKFSEVRIYSTVFQTPEGTAHNAEEAKIESIPFRRVPLEPAILNHVFGVSTDKTSSDSSLLLKPVKYFVCITEVDTETTTITVMSPKNESLSGENLIMGEIKIVS